LLAQNGGVDTSWNQVAGIPLTTGDLEKRSQAQEILSGITFSGEFGINDQLPTAPTGFNQKIAQTPQLARA
jgi:hypothetical protein